MLTVAVIGGGASGLMAALTAAGDKHNKVLLFERQQRVGKKLLATGNGRCNLTNTAAVYTDYTGVESAPDFTRPALEAFTPRDTLAFFESLGLLTAEQYGGRVYPFSDSANSVVDVLRYAVDAAGVETLAARCVSRVSKSGSSFNISLPDAEYRADKVIIACGGTAGGKVGGVSDGYELLKALGHSRTKLYPSLVPVNCASPYPRSLKGVRTEAVVTLYGRNGAYLAEGKGELQFTETGISGPVVFDLSRNAATSGEGTVGIDLLPGLTTDEVYSLLMKRREALPGLSAGELLTGMLHNRLGKMAVKYAGLDLNKALAEISAAELRAVAAACKDFSMRFTGTGGFDNAQVTAGGIRTSEFISDTLESLIVPGLYACGEVLDTDARCGGFNLQWAWSSGRLAGRLL